jgi:hypothetical protein
MADLATQKIDEDGQAVTYAAAAGGGDTLTPGSRVFIHCKNTNAAPRIVTVNSQKNCDQGFDHNLVVTIPANTGDVMIGPITASRFGRASDGKAEVTYDAVTNLTIAVLEI